MAFLKSFFRSLAHLGTFIGHFFLLAVRLFWGYQFYITGLGKLQNPAPAIEFFTSLGIPMPTLNVYLVGTVEMIGGLLLIVGLASRLVSIPLMTTMAIAFVTTHRDVLVSFLDNPSAIVSQSPFNFFLAALIIFCFGPGWFSIDAILKKIFNRRKKDYDHDHEHVVVRESEPVLPKDTTPHL